MKLEYNEIKKMLDIRDGFLDQVDEDFKVLPPFMEKADQIESSIAASLHEHYNEYGVDEIIETLTRFGQAPCLVYDDNGMFAVSSDGYGPHVVGDEVISGSMQVIVNRTMWKKTIREALWFYMTHEWSLEDEDEETQKGVKMLMEQTEENIKQWKKEQQ